LEAGALNRVPVKFLSLAACPLLTHLEADSLSGLDRLETLTLNANPALAYVHPGALAGVPALVALDLTHNNLSALEDLQPYVPSLRSLYLAGNVLRCHCGLSWLKSNLGGGGTGGGGSSTGGGGFVVQDGDKVKCSGGGLRPLSAAASTSSSLSQADLSECSPFILPLFPAESEADMGHNISWACRPIGTAMRVSWHLPNGTALVAATCSEAERACVRPGGELTLSYLHPADEGLYTCRVVNTHGEDVRTVRLHVKVLVHTV
jgi:hypothetical protein